MEKKPKTQTEIIANGIIRGVADCLLRFLIFPAIITASVSFIFKEEEKLTYSIFVYGISLVIIILITIFSDVKEYNEVGELGSKRE